MRVPLLRVLIATGAVISLAACTVFPEQPAHRIFQLPAPAVQESSDKPVDSTLRVSIPLAVTPIDSSRILVKPGAHEIRAYEGSRWSNRAPVVLGNYLLESFRRDGRVATVITDTSPARSDLTLAGDLTRFQAEYRDGTPVVHLYLNLQLINERTRETVANRRFEVRHPADGESVEAVVEAFGQASHQLARQAINWTLDNI
ncbi:ABC-type transport auxiliary lipoprotein family protein [Marinobacter sp. TBZ242]|uniref:ABC-type transport auxiliary lipoprotein family protein n=1 Tax=Marinobacter azerbaijanicus TaxID=3050455 RepID=A0ABT7IFT4_9GAMM|nr:ABC-type transport auxiliary lipoprotein family protein [Marinobacter sp. TBZ242]MDL0433025.1 ABC-type transport auxiliary lipoprotein family protein [Marinobacter sp. TBZ242]